MWAVSMWEICITRPSRVSQSIDGSSFIIRSSILPPFGRVRRQSDRLAKLIGGFEVTTPRAADRQIGLERDLEAEGRAGRDRVTGQYLADLFGEVSAATNSDLVVNPGDDDHVAVPTVAEASVQLVMDLSQPSLADDRFRGRDNEVERGVQRAHGHAPPVEARQPSVPVRVVLQALA